MENDNEKSEDLKELQEASEEFNDLIESEETVAEIEKKEEEKQKEIEEEKQHVEEEKKRKEEQEKKDKVSFLLKTIPIIVVLLCVIGILFHFILHGNDRLKSDDSLQIVNANVLTEKKDEILKNKKESNESIQKEVDKRSTTDEYKEYEKLTDEEKEELDVIPRKEEVPYEELDEIKDKIDYDDKSKIPEKYNLADVMDIKVEDQQSFGLCWDFASLNSLETNIYLKHGKMYDFSEIHLDYLESNLLFGYRSVHDGGSFQVFENYYSKSGSPLESKYEYRDYSKEEYSLFPNDKGIVSATETVNYPSKRSIDENADNYEELVKEYRNVIKTHIMNYGSLYASISTEGMTRGKPDTFNDSTLWANHAISIVGWDDTYSKDHFLSQNGNVPEHDGAYIALNSWGDWWGDNGYFYISYDDITVENTLSGVINTSLDMDGYIALSTIKNDYFYSEINEKLANSIVVINGRKYISKLALKGINFSDLSDKGITDEDIEFINILKLSMVDLSKNHIKDISKLNTDSMYWLDVSDNDIESIDDLDLGNIWSFSVANNKITSIENVDFKNVEVLDLSGNDIKDLSSLKGNLYEQLTLNDMHLLDSTTIPSNVTRLVAKNSNVTKLPEGMDGLEELDLSNNNKIDLTTIPDNLYSLTLDECELSSLEGLEEQSLSYLSIKNNQFEDLSSLIKISPKAYLDVSGNPIKDYSSLKDFKKYDDYYTELIMNDVGLEDISVLNNLSFEMISVKNNQIKDVSGYTGKVNYLDLSGNPINGNISSLKDVEMLVLNNCNLNEIIINNDMNIYYLSLDENGIDNYDFLEKLKSLEGLSIENSKKPLTGIHSETLYSLNIASNNINHFDVSGLTGLGYLNVSNNQNIDLNDILNTYKIHEAPMTVVAAGVDVSYDDYVTLKNKIDSYSSEESVIDYYEFDVVIKAKSNKILLDDYQELDVFKTFDKSSTIENGYYNPTDNSIEVVDSRKKNIVISGAYDFHNGLYYDKIKIVFEN